jgi:hypothetical protein
LRIEIGEGGFRGSAGDNQANRIELRGERTVVLYGEGPGITPGNPLMDYAQPMLLSPAGDRLIWPPRLGAGGAGHLDLIRCPAA